jgi:hypothetical protein
VLALGIGACGGGSGTTGDGSDTSATGTTTDATTSPEATTRTDESGTSTKTGDTTKAPAKAAPSCSSQLDPFLGQLDDLRKSLVIGVSYEQYVAELETVRRSYAKLPVDKLDFACLSGAAAGAEESFDSYLAAANTWGDCVSESGCETATLEPRLQREWHAAAKQLRAAQKSEP